MKIYITLAIFSLLSVTLAIKGADLYLSASDDCLAALKKEGVAFIITRCYMNVGMPDHRCGENLDAAADAGFATDIYIYPCPGCGAPEKQVAETIANVGNRKVGKYWVFVENFQWKDKAYNRVFLRTMMAELKKLGKTAGIYTSEYLWDSVMGLDWTEMAVYPLWYKRSDGNAACMPFKPFAGWAKPFMKQYMTTALCNGSSLEGTC